MNDIKKAVFPVAGLGTRFLPATKASPKEMLCIVDKPLIQYAVEEAIEAGNKDAVTGLMTNEWLDDCTISGSASKVRERLAEWANAGVMPIAVMSSTTGGQAKAIGELFEAYN